MKNLKVYVMLFAVASVWGGVIYRVLGKDDAGNSVFREVKVDMKQTVEHKVFVFEINGAYPDPFLGNMNTQKLNRTSYASARVMSSAVPTAPIKLEKWPLIQYMGMVSNEKTGTGLALILMNDRVETVKPEQVLNSIKIKKIYRDSIVVAWGRKIKTIRK